MEKKYTKGPWEWNGSCAIYGQYKNNTGIIFRNSDIRLDLDFDQEEQDANCQLASTAPELVNVLEDILEWIENHDEWWLDCPGRGGFDIEKISKVLSKACGDKK